MNLENASKIIFEGYRAIGLKETDMNRLSSAMQKASFTESASLVADNNVASTVSEAVNVGPEVIAANQPIVPEVQTNMFDSQNMQSDVVSTVNVFDSPMMSDEVQGGQTVNNVTPLDTPQSFFAREEQETLSQSSLVNEVANDPVILMINEVTDAYNRQNATIKGLNQKVVMLEEQLRQSEEARKVAEAQRFAAEQTLAGARQAEGSGGPTLVYQQSYNKAA